MKPAVLKILAFSFILTTAVSCKKSDPVSPAAPKSKTTIITQSAWKVKTVGLDANKDGIAESDVTLLIQACKLDNIYTFKTDGSGTMDEAAIKCVGTDPQTVPFTWLFKNTETVLSGTFSFTNGDATIITLNDTSLVVGYVDAATGSNLVATLQH